MNKENPLFCLKMILCALSFLGLAFPLNLYAHKGEDHSKRPQVQIEIPRSLERDALGIINAQYAQEIRPIFVRACFDCHSQAPKYPWYYKLPVVGKMIDEDIREARSHLDFTKGFPFESHGTPKEDLQAILESIEKSSMPPKNYLWLHSDARLKESDKDKIKVWVLRSLELIRKQTDTK